MNTFVKIIIASVATSLDTAAIQITLSANDQVNPDNKEEVALFEKSARDWIQKGKNWEAFKAESSSQDWFCDGGAFHELGFWEARFEELEEEQAKKNQEMIDHILKNMDEDHCPNFKEQKTKLEAMTSEHLSKFYQQVDVLAGVNPEAERFTAFWKYDLAENKKKLFGPKKRFAFSSGPSERKKRAHDLATQLWQQRVVKTSKLHRAFISHLENRIEEATRDQWKKYLMAEIRKTGADVSGAALHSGIPQLIEEWNFYILGDKQPDNSRFGGIGEDASNRCSDKWEKIKCWKGNCNSRMKGFTCLVLVWGILVLVLLWVLEDKYNATDLVPSLTYWVFLPLFLMTWCGPVSRAIDFDKESLC